MRIEAYKERHITSLDRIRALKLSPNDYVVIGGAVLEFLGIRDTNDVDLVVSKKVYTRLSKKNWKEYIQDDGKKILTHSGYIIMQHWLGRDLETLQKSAIKIKGIPLIGLKELVECKSQLGRKKDLRDVASIQEYERANQLNASVHLRPAVARVRAH